MLQEWIVWGVAFVALLAADFIFMKGRNVTVKRSLTLCGAYIAVAMAFAGYLYFDKGATSAMEYTTIYWLEKMLSVDNLLVISLIFAYFKIPKKQQHTALLYGIVGAIVMRMAFVYSGAELIKQFEWAIFAFAAFLIWTGYKISFGDEEIFEPEDSWIIQQVKKAIGSSANFVAAIVAIEISDVMFAVDSIPASFSVSRDPFIVLTANLFAVLGLRSLYHAMAHGLDLFKGMEKFIGVALVFLGLEVFVNHFYMELPAWVTMTVVFSILAIGAWKNRPIPPLTVKNATVKRLRQLPRKKWDETIGSFDSMIIMPTGEEHCSGWGAMDFVAVRGETPFMRLSGCSDVLHINGIGGFGKDWVKRYGTVPSAIPPAGWSIDCIQKSGLLRLFCLSGKLVDDGMALSSYEIFCEEREYGQQTTASTESLQGESPPLITDQRADREEKNGA